MPSRLPVRRKWTAADGVTYQQHVSTQPSTRTDALELQRALDDALAARKARATGLCPVRSAVYRETFDELIRQVGVDSPERGALLRRVRDQLEMTTQAYAAVCASSVVFGAAKHEEGGKGAPDEEAALAALQARKDAVEAEVSALRGRVEATTRKAAESRAAAEKRRSDELNCLRVQTKHLDAFLKSRS